MRFLAPQLLYFLPLALLPLVIYFLVLRRALKVDFPGLSLIRKVYAKNIRGRRFLRAAVLALRVLAAALLVVAFARPMLERMPGRLAGAATRDVPANVVILLDLSYSTRAEFAARPVSALLKEAGVAIVNRLAPGDRVAVGAFSDRWEGTPLAWESPAAAASRLRGYEPGWRGTAYRAALEKAFAFLAPERGGKKAVIVLTDGFEQGFKSFGTGGLGSVPGYNSDVAVYGLSLPSGVNNRWGQSVTLEGAGLLDGGAKTVPVVSARFAATGADKRAATATADIAGLRTRPRALTPQTDGTFLARWPLTSFAGNMLAGKVIAARDALPGDETIYFSCRLPRAPKLLCLSSDPQFLLRGHGGAFLQNVMGSGAAGVTGFSCQFFDLARLADLQLSDYQGVIVAGFSDIGLAQAQQLRRFVLAGGNLMLVAGPLAQPSAFRFMEDILPLRPVRAESAAGLAAPLLLPPPPDGSFNWTGYQFGDIKTTGFLLSTAAEGAKVLWRLKYRGGEYPAFAVCPAGSGRVYMWTPGIETGWTDFALRPVFPVWAAYTAALLGKTDIKASCMGTVVGGTFSLPVAEDFSGAVTLTPPSGSPREVRPAGGVYRFNGTDEPGLYRVTSRDGKAAQTMFAVNPDGAGGESVTVLQKSPPWTALKFEDPAGDFFARLGGLELFAPLMAAALALFALEFFLAGLL